MGNSALKIPPMVDWVNVKDYGAHGDVSTLGSGGTDDTSAFNTALAALPTVDGQPAGVIYVPAGAYRINGAINAIGCYVSIIGAGIEASILDYRGSGDCLRVFNNAAVSDKTIQFGGQFKGFTIYGNGAAAGACGLHLGDIIEAELDLCVRDFNAGSSSIGYHFDNTLTWTERLHGRIVSEYNSKAVVFDINQSLAATKVASYSFGGTNLDIHIVAGDDPTFGPHTGVIVQNGAFLYHSRLNITGLFTCNGGADNSASVLQITGAVPAGFPNAGSASGVYTSQLDIQVEAYSDGTTAQPVETIRFGTSSNYVSWCVGILDFSNGGTTFTSSNLASATGASFDFYGTVNGDSALNGSYSWNTWTPSPSGFSSTSFSQAYYVRVGKTIHFAIQIAGTSNATTKHFTLPTHPSTNFLGIYQQEVAWVGNNGGTQAAAGMASYNHGTPGQMDVFLDGASTAWTASGAAFYIVRGTYETA